LPGFTSTAEIKSDQSITIKRERERERERERGKCSSRPTRGSYLAIRGV
jgi:hypothetical protein